MTSAICMTSDLCTPGGPQRRVTMSVTMNAFLPLCSLCLVMTTGLATRQADHADDDDDVIGEACNMLTIYWKDLLALQTHVRIR